jgi:hypothetical protein
MGPPAGGRQQGLRLIESGAAADIDYDRRTAGDQKVKEFLGCDGK